MYSLEGISEERDACESGEGSDEGCEHTEGEDPESSSDESSLGEGWRGWRIVGRGGDCSRKFVRFLLGTLS